MNAPSTHLGLLAATILLVATAQVHASASAYHFFDLGTHGGTNANSTARAINNVGQVAGFSYRSDEETNNLALLWNGTTATQLNMLPTGFQSRALAINDAGQTVGFTRTAGTYRHATLWNGTTPTDLGTGPMADAFAYGINNAGQIVGRAGRATIWNGITPSTLPDGVAVAITNAGRAAGAGSTGATVWNDITKPGTPLDKPSDAIELTLTVAVALNDHGQAAGHANELGYNWRAIAWNGTTATILEVLPGGGNSAAYGINDTGQIVGWTSGVGGATLWDDNKPIDLNNLVDPSILDAGWVLRRAYDINDKGWIVGDAYNSKLDVTHAFLLSPVPEPGTCAMLLAGLGLLGLSARHRRFA